VASLFILLHTEKVAALAMSCVTMAPGPDKGQDVGYDASQERFGHLYAAHFDAVLGYALRRSAAEDAADVAAETFLVAWRRLDDVPEGDATRPWLYGVARRALANLRRGARRRDHLAEVLRVELRAAVPDHSDDTVARIDAEVGLAQLPHRDREVLRLATWEGLEPREIAVVLDLTQAAVRKRLSRARARLRQLGHDSRGSGHLSSVRPPLAPEEGNR
jgi:RNA polymerase sigma factor (sigma-70 family)